MNRHAAGLYFLLIALWGCGNAEIPTVEVGGSSGARILNGQAKTPGDAYDNAYAQLTRAHYNVRRNLESRGQNQYGAQEAMGQIVQSLETMRACVPADGQPPFDPYIARYTTWKTDIEKGTWGGAFLNDFERTEREVKSKFNPTSVQVLAEFPGAPKTGNAPAPKTGEQPLIADKVEVPANPKPGPAEAPKPVVEPTPPPDPVVIQRVLYKAWDKAHLELVAAYTDKKDCKPKYDDVVASLRLMKEKQTADLAGKVQIYLEYYADIDAKTKGFTALPEKTTTKDILDELDVAARVLRKTFNPDK